MSSFKWVLICGVLNATAGAVVALLAAFSDLSDGTLLAIGSLFVVVSVWPFSKAQAARAAAEQPTTKSAI